MVINALSEHKIDINMCRGQSYDNAANMSGKYRGVQARMKIVVPEATFVPCGGHSLNLIGNTLQSVVCGLYHSSDLFSRYLTSCPYRHTDGIFRRYRRSRRFRCEVSSDTRWSARNDAVQALLSHYFEISKALERLSENPDENRTTQDDAIALRKKMDQFEISFMSVMWASILASFDKATNTIQEAGIDIRSVVHLYDGMKTFIISIR